jgi:hypothetical protein
MVLVRTEEDDLIFKHDDITSDFVQLGYAVKHYKLNVEEKESIRRFISL